MGKVVSTNMVSSALYMPTYLKRKDMKCFKKKRGHTNADRSQSQPRATFPFKKCLLFSSISLLYLFSPARTHLGIKPPCPGANPVRKPSDIARMKRKEGGEMKIRRKGEISPALCSEKPESFNAFTSICIGTLYECRKDGRVPLFDLGGLITCLLDDENFITLCRFPVLP